MTATPATNAISTRPPAAAAEAERFLLLDGLRGLAAFAVILDHAPPNVLGELAPGRYLAVDFFFVLSGFVLSHAYGRKLEGGWSVLRFMRARVIRLYPLYLLGLATGVGLSLLAVIRGWETSPIGPIGLAVLCGLLFLPAPAVSSFGGGQLYPFNSPSWSLFFELLVNLVWGLIARVLSWRVLGAILGFSAVAVWATLNRHPEVGGPGWEWKHFDAGLARVMFGFFAGVALYRLRGRVRIPAIPAILPALGFIAVIAVPAPAGWRPAYDAMAAILLMPVLVAFASEAKVAGLVGRACAGLGAISYGVYVLHVPLLGVLSIAVLAAHADPPALAVVAMIVPVAGIAAAVLHVWFDRPVRRWLDENLPGGARARLPRTVRGEHG